MMNLSASTTDLLQTFAKYINYATGQQEIIQFDDVGQVQRERIFHIFEYYSKFSTAQLVALCHEFGGPWDVTYNDPNKEVRGSLRIPNDLIQRHFQKNIGGNLRS